MPDHFLLKTQRNAVMQAVQEAGFDPREFEWGEQTTRATKYGPGWNHINVPVLSHKTGAFFVFDYDEQRGHQYANYVPAEDQPERFTNAGDWETCFGYVRQWLQNLRREYDAPDLWRELEEHGELLGGEPGVVENTPFTPEEQAEISAQLGELRAYLVQAHELTSDQLDAINARLADLEDAAGRTRRLDWRHMAIGSLLSLVIDAIVPVGVVQDVLRFVGHTLGHLFGGGDATREVPGGPPEVL